MSQREVTVRQLIDMLARFPGVTGKRGASLEDLLASSSCLLRVDGDVAYSVMVDDTGVLTLVSSHREQQQPTFVTNNVRAFVVQLAFRVLIGRSEWLRPVGWCNS